MVLFTLLDRIIPRLIIILFSFIEAHHVDKTVRQHQCPHCSYNTFAKRYLQSHILTVHDESAKKLICEKCSRRFRFPDLLKRHACGAVQGRNLFWITHPTR